MDRSEWRREAARNALSRLLPRLEASHKHSLADIPARSSRKMLFNTHNTGFRIDNLCPESPLPMNRSDFDKNDFFLRLLMYKPLNGRVFVIGSVLIRSVGRFNALVGAFPVYACEMNRIRIANVTKKRNN
jgi:hypothetical protein